MSSTLLKPDFPGPAAPPAPRRTADEPGSWRQALREAGRWILERADGFATSPPPLQLELTDRFVSFRGLEEFEFALASRIDYPAHRVRALMDLTPVEMERASARIRAAERRFAGVLARSLDEPGLVGEFFRELDLKLFSQDHDWREIVDGLRRLSPDHDPYKRIALIRYMQYLRARQQVLRGAFAEKTRDDDGAGLHAVRAADDGSPRDAGATARRAAAGGPREGFRQLPKGETVAIDLGDERALELRLAGNRMRLFTGRECYLVDDGGATHALRPGRNLVGRHRGCDVVVDAACRAVSRTHLVIEATPANRVLLTDLSSHGTEVPARAPRGTR